MGTSFAFAAIIPLIVLTILVVWSIRAIWLTVTLPAGAPSQPACEKCRYPVAGLTAFQCPECGGDLRLTGIITRSMEMRRRGSLLSAGLGLAVLAFAVMLLSFGFVSVLVRTQSVAPSSRLTVDATLKPRSGSHTVRVQQNVLTGSQPVTGEVRLTYTLADGASRTVMIDFADHAVATIDGAGVAQRAGAYGPKVIHDLFVGAGADPSDPAVAAEIADMQTLADRVVASPGMPLQAVALKAYSVTGSNTASNGGGVMTTQASQLVGVVLMLGIPVLGIGAWIGGFVLIVRRRRRLMREVEDQVAGAARPVALSPPLAG